MKLLFLLGVFALIAISSCVANNLVLGSTYDGRVVWQHESKYMGIPFKKRVKEVFYTDPGQQPIRAIVALDGTHTDASATVTAGGLGYPYVNLRLKSERGHGLDYHIEIFV